ncbi:MAG: hypothetical protein V7746_14805 [Halioglobus sp.]
MTVNRSLSAALCLLLTLTACGSDSNRNRNNTNIMPEPVPADPVAAYALANGCYNIVDGQDQSRILIANDGSYTFSSTTTDNPARFLLRPADLGIYLLYDQDKHYLTADDTMLMQQAKLLSDTRKVDDKIIIEDRMQSEGEWELMPVENGKFQLHHLKSDNYLSSEGVLSATINASGFELLAADDCADFPELSLDAEGEITKTQFDDGDVYGFVDAHSHLFTNFAFGGGGVFHGSPFNRLGVEHALDDCDLPHGDGGRKDIMGYAFGANVESIADLIPALIAGELPEDTHDTRGYPDFPSWPDAPFSSTHQMQYYKWIERAWMGGLRLMVQHATTNELLCQLTAGIGAQPKRYDCNDMVAVDRIIEETYALERYIDALSGGPGEGWFRIVFSPEQAREQIKLGRLAVVMGIETSDVFNCFLVPFGEFKPCTEADVNASLDEYYERGVRVLFPVHKYDNAFSAGDGDRGIIEIGNIGHTGHYTNFVKCSEDLLSFDGGFDSGGASAASLNQPRDVYDSPPPLDMSNFEADPISALLPVVLMADAPLQGDYCQKHGLTDLGEFLIKEIMKRGMVLEVDHFPRKSYQQAYDLMNQFDYPAAGTHGRNKNGELYALGGISKTNFGRCRSIDSTATMDDGFQQRIALKKEKGAYPSEGFAFDLNGFAGYPKPRFGPNSSCNDPQTDDGITYPFTSYGGDVTFTQPMLANRTVDFNNEGMVHLGLVVEVIEDVRRDGVSDEELEPLFRSAEAYIRMWEKSELRGREISGD